MNAEVDTTGWTIYEPALCQCVDARTEEGRSGAVLIMDLISNDEQYHITAFFNVTKTKKGHFSVGDKSKFAKLYRSTIGENSKRLKGKANQLVKHFIGESFHVEFKQALNTFTNSHYLKATGVKPVTPIETDEWFSSGELKGCTRGSYKARNRKRTGNKLEVDWKQAGTELEVINPVHPQNNLASTVNSNALKHHTLGVSTHRYVDKRIISDKEKVYWYEQQPDEDLYRYYDRVIDDSW